MVIVNVPLQKLLPYADICTWVENNTDLVSVLDDPLKIPYYAGGLQIKRRTIFNGLLFADEQDAVYFKLKFGI
jgi:hypothetical protein